MIRLGQADELIFLSDENAKEFLLDGPKTFSLIPLRFVDIFASIIFIFFSLSVIFNPSSNYITALSHFQTIKLNVPH